MKHSFYTYTIPVMLLGLLILGIGSCDTIPNEPPALTNTMPRIGPSPLPGVSGLSYKARREYEGDQVQTGMAGSFQHPSVDWKVLESILTDVQQQLGHSLVGFYSVSDSGRGVYYYAASELYFSQKAIDEARGATKPYMFESGNRSQIPTQLFIGYIPDSEQAEDELLAWIRSKNPGMAEPEPASTLNFESSSIGEEHFECSVHYYVMEPDGPITIVIRVYEDCNAATGYRYPQDDSAGDNDNSDDNSAGGGSGGDTGGGSIGDVPCDEQLIPTGGCPPGPGGQGFPGYEEEDPEKDCAGVEGGIAYIDGCGTCVGGTTGKISCCASFNKAMEFILSSKAEGGFVDHPDDQGGPTNRGIAWDTWQSTAKKVLGLEPTLSNLKKLTKNQAREIYRKHFWERSKVSNLLDGDLTIFFFDFYVNAPSASTLRLQKTLKNMNYNLRTDAILGDETRNAVNQAIKDGNLLELYNRYYEARIQHYIHRANTVPGQKSFIDGWLNRVEKFSKKSSLNLHNVNCKL